MIEIFISDGPDGNFESAAVVDASAAQEDLAASGLIAVRPAAHAIYEGRQNGDRLIIFTAIPLDLFEETI